MPAPLPRNQRPQIMAAIGGIDIALWDIKGKAVGLPVFRLLGGTRTEVFTYATGGYYLRRRAAGTLLPRNRRFRRRRVSRGQAEDGRVVVGATRSRGSARCARRSAPTCC